MLILVSLLSTAVAAEPLPIDHLQLEHEGSIAHVHYAVPAATHAALQGQLGLELRVKDGAGTVLGEFAAPMAEARGKASFTLPKGAQGQEAEVWLTVGGVVAPVQAGGLVIRRVTLEPQSGAPTSQVASQDWSLAASVISSVPAAGGVSV